MGRGAAGEEKGLVPQLAVTLLATGFSCVWSTRPDSNSSIALQSIPRRFARIHQMHCICYRVAFGSYESLAHRSRFALTLARETVLESAISLLNSRALPTCYLAGVAETQLSLPILFDVTAARSLPASLRCRSAVRLGRGRTCCSAASRCKGHRVQVLPGYWVRPVSTRP